MATKFLNPDNAQVGDVRSVPQVDDGTDIYFSHALESLLRITAKGSFQGMLGEMRRREAIAATAVMAFLSLEACINRLYFEAFEQEPASRECQEFCV